MYDKELLRSWASMEGWGDYLIQNGGVNKYSSKDGFDFLQREYFQIVQERINYCKELLKTQEDAELCYVLAGLFDRMDLDSSPDYLYKRHVRFWCQKALELDPDYEPAKKLLDEVKEWVGFVKEKY